MEHDLVRLPPSWDSQGVGWLKVVIGAGIVLFAITEMFDDLFHPTRSGVLSEWVSGRMFRLFRRWPPLLPTSGPLSMAAVMGIWALLLATGFALIYWAFFPESYRLQTATMPAPREYFWWSFYYSLEMMTTLGLGDLQPNPTWLKLLSAFHTLIGFSLVTASITWTLLVFPALRRMRTLSRKANSLMEAERRTGVRVVSAGMHVVLAGLAEEVVQARVDLIHFPLLFYFYAEDDRASLPCALFPLMRFAEEGAASERDDLVRLSANALRIALEDLADLIGERLKCEERSPEVAFQAFADLHRP